MIRAFFAECLGLAELGKTDELLRLAEEQEVRWADGREKRRIANAAEDYRDYTEKEDTAIAAAQKECRSPWSCYSGQPTFNKLTILEVS